MVCGGLVVVAVLVADVQKEQENLFGEVFLDTEDMFRVLVSNRNITFNKTNKHLQDLKGLQ